MSRTKHTLIAKVKFAWWWKFYVVGVVAMARLTGLDVCPEKLDYWFRKAATIHFKASK